jgi:hypothetical protein
MPLYFSSAGDAEQTAASLNDLIKSARAQIEEWRNRLNLSPTIDGETASEKYQAVVSLRSFILNNNDIPGLIPAYIRRFPQLPNGYNVKTEAAAAMSTIVDFAAWFQANWPHKTAQGYPAFQQFGNASANGQLIKLTIDLDASALQTLKDKLDAMLAAMVPAPLS